MGTRAVYTFNDSDREFHVYKHWDGCPAGAVEFIKNALAYAWPLPRFDAAEFAAAFVAANKQKGDDKRQGGDVYLTDHYETHGDLSYRYVISLKDENLHVVAYSMGDRSKKIFEGTLEQFAEFAETNPH
jgi:hypothetical protein